MVPWKKSRLGQCSCLKYPTLVRCDAKNPGDQNLLCPSLSPRCRQPLGDVLPPDSDSDFQLRLWRNLYSKAPKCLFGVLTKYEMVKYV